MDEKTARQKIENIVGYIHPTGTNSARGNLYKTFSNTESGKDINNFKNTIVSKQYKTQGSDDTKSCPICKINIYTTCPCVYSDKTCKNGHTFYFDRDDGKIRIGKPH